MTQSQADPVVVVEAVQKLPSRKELAVHSCRTATVKNCAGIFLELCSKECNKDKFASFSTKLLLLLNSTIPKLKLADTTLTKHRAKLWITYSKLRSDKLPILWNDFLRDLGCLTMFGDPMFMELVNESLLDDIIKTTYAVSHKNPSTPHLHLHLSIEEENIMRYACGYVGMKLHNRFVKQHGQKPAAFVECIDHMYAEGPSSSLLEYTRVWLDKVNRGGLFDVSDESYLLFFAIEEAMIDRLTTHIKSSIYLSPSDSEERKRAIIDCVVNDVDVQYRWDVVSVSIDDERDSLELLGHVVGLWLTIRGYAITKAWMEEYKWSTQTTTKGKKSLRKELKKKSEASEESA